MTPYRHGHSSMAWIDGLPAAWRALVNEYNSVSGIKYAIRRGMTVEQVRAKLEKQRVDRQWEPIEEQGKKPDFSGRARGLKRMVSNFNAWLADHPPEKRRKRGLTVASIIALAPMLKALAMVVR